MRTTNMALEKISESVYVGQCLKIGTTQQVSIRRDALDIRESFQNQSGSSFQVMQSGSHREGFRLEGSDVDTMFWPIDHPVLWDFSQAERYSKERHNFILCDTSESPPGFALLWLPLEKASHEVLLACVKINGCLYISSARYRGITLSKIRSRSTIHGPCSSARDGALELDDAHCFVSHFWPPIAKPWIDRCHSWPTQRVIDDIIKSGCHFVAIGHKLCHHVDNEWRISFSQAEQKLVYAMNHTQFLTYGLLKLFLKEIINNGLAEEEKLLCSYHMKTVIFWAIQQNAVFEWCPKTLLQAFWICFKTLLKWVYEGVCPNFFIPENNMFLNKVFGNAQKNLFNRLNRLYENGVTFLLQIPLIRFHFLNVLCDPKLCICTDERTLITEDVIDANLFQEIYKNDVPLTSIDLHSCMKSLRTVEQFKRSTSSESQKIMLQKLTATILQRCAFILHSMCINTPVVNKNTYCLEKTSRCMLKLAVNCGFVSDMLYIAMYCYKTLRFDKALSVVQLTNCKLTEPYLMYAGEVVDQERYREIVGGQSWSFKMGYAVAMNIILDNKITYINDLVTEQWSCFQSNKPILCIPPVILSHMIEFLCCTDRDIARAKDALEDLQKLVYHDQGMLVPEHLRDISWEILGICQQISGNHQAALYSYQTSLEQEPFNGIQSATMYRIQSLDLPSQHIL